VLHTTDISNPRLEAIRGRRAEIAVEIARLTAENDALNVEAGRIEAEAEIRMQDPYLVGPQWLIAKLDTSERSFWRLVKNETKGFPKATYGVTSDPKWLWHEVKAWLAANR